MARSREPHSLDRAGARVRPATVETDFRQGGAFSITMHGERAYHHTGEYLEIVPNERIVFTWHSHFMPPDVARTRVTVEFEAVGQDPTRLRLLHEELPDSDAYEGHESGWATVLERLAVALDRDPAPSRGSAAPG